MSHCSMLVKQMESLRKKDETGSDCPRMPAVSESASQYMTIFNQMAKFTNINPSKKHITASHYQYQKHYSILITECLRREKHQTKVSVNWNYLQFTTDALYYLSNSATLLKLLK